MSRVAPKEGYVTIPQAAPIAGVEDSRYIRVLLRKGHFPGTIKRKINKKQWRYEIPIEELEVYAKRAKRTRRSDGRAKYLLYMTDDEAEVVAKLFKQAGIECPYDRAYKPAEPTDLED